jgi:hypothetical protein
MAGVDSVRVVDDDDFGTVPERFRPALEAVVERLAAGDYEGLKRDGIDPHPDADLSYWIRDYGPSGATVVLLPEEAWASADAIETVVPGEWAVVVWLWTREEGRSDLAMEATVTESPDGGASVVVDNIHVL